MKQCIQCKRVKVKLCLVRATNKLVCYECYPKYYYHQVVRPKAQARTAAAREQRRQKAESKAQEKQKERNKRQLRNQDIVQRYDRGESMRDIGAVHSLSPEGVRIILRSLDCQLRSAEEARKLKRPSSPEKTKPPKPPKRYVMHELLTAEWLRIALWEQPDEPSLAMVAAWLGGGVHSQTILNVCKYHGVPVRSRGAAQKARRKHGRTGKKEKQ